LNWVLKKYDDLYWENWEIRAKKLQRMKGGEVQVIRYNDGENDFD
jgi:hypothetical protein